MPPDEEVSPAIRELARAAIAASINTVGDPFMPGIRVIWMTAIVEKKLYLGRFDVGGQWFFDFMYDAHGGSVFLSALYYNHIVMDLTRELNKKVNERRF